MPDRLEMVVGGQRQIALPTTPSGTLTTLHTLTGGADGANPYAGMISNSAGNLYGTTENGGADGGGVVFEIPGCAPAGGRTSGTGH